MPLAGLRTNRFVETPSIVLDTDDFVGCNGIGEPVGAAVTSGVGVVAGTGEAEADGAGVGAVVEIASAEAVIEVEHDPLATLTCA